MITKDDAYAAALQQKASALEEKKRKHTMLIAAAYETHPRLSEIDRLQSSLGADIAITALSGDISALSTLQVKLTALADEKKAIYEKSNIKDIVYDCPLCNDTGYINGKICDCVKALAKGVIFKQLSSEMPLEESTFQNFDLKYYPDCDNENGINARKKMTAIFKFCREYALRFNPETSPNLLFLGDAGLGKTHLTLAIVSAVLELGFDVVYGSAYNLLSMVEKEHFSNEKGNSYEALLGCDLLVIDDLGTEFTSPFTLSVLYNVINSRILSKKPTVLNTNLSLAEIEKRYTPRIASRLIGNYEARKFFGKDIRQIKAMEK